MLVVIAIRVDIDKVKDLCEHLVSDLTQKRYKSPPKIQGR